MYKRNQTSFIEFYNKFVNSTIYGFSYFCEVDVETWNDYVHISHIRYRDNRNCSIIRWQHQANILQSIYTGIRCVNGYILTKHSNRIFIKGEDLVVPKQTQFVNIHDKID